MEWLLSQNVRATYISAHVHATYEEEPKNRYAPHVRGFVVGGGGGWACDGYQGYLSADIDTYGNIQNVELHKIPWSRCCSSGG